MGKARWRRDLSEIVSSKHLVPRQTLGQFVQQLLFALVFGALGFVAVALYKFAQALDPGECLLPGVTGLVQVVLVPLQALALLIDSGVELRQEALKTQQPLTGHAGAAAHDPLLRVIQTEGVEVGEFALGHFHLPLKVAQALHGGFLGLLGHVHHRRQTRGSTQGHDRLPAGRRGENRFEVRLAFTQADFVVEPLTQVSDQLRLQIDGKVRLAVTASDIGADADQVAALLIA